MYFICSVHSRKMCAVLIVLLLLCSRGMGQNVIMTGQVRDSITKMPISGAIVFVPASGQQVLTDNAGKFSLGGTLDVPVMMRVSCVGYNDWQGEVDNDNNYIIDLSRKSYSLQDITITASMNNLYYTKILSQLDINAHPAKSAQDLLRLVPGLFVAQHQGGGKAEGIAVRGFDADHGTDFNVSVDGMPVNLPAHAHGQGYADLHFLIPELIDTYQWGKGPYYTSKGDFTTAGFVQFNTKDYLAKNFIKLEAGRFATTRMVGAVNLLTSKQQAAGKSLFIAGSGLYSNGGPFTDVPEHFKRFNGFGKFVTPIGRHSRLKASVSSLWSKWFSSGEIPERAVDLGYIDSRWGAFDSSQKGFTTRTNVIVQVNTDLGSDLQLNNEAYYSNYHFNLFTNFSGFYFYPDLGDEFRQYENRNLFGYTSTISKQNYLRNVQLSTQMGIGFRTDLIDPIGLDHTQDAQFLENIELGRARETNAFGFWGESLRWGKWLLDLGMRYDYFNYYYKNQSVNKIAKSLFDGAPPSTHSSIVSPKINVVYTFDSTFQLFVKAGKGFHSNDVRVVISRNGNEFLPAAYGIESGFNWKPIPRMYLNTSLWYLYLQSEFTYGSDLIDQPGGPLEASGKTLRYGIDFSGRYQVLNWLYAGLNLNWAHPRSMDDPKGSNYIPLAPTFTSTAELNIKFKKGLNGGISYRYMGDRPGNEDYSLKCNGYFVTDLSLKYTRKNYEFGLTVENLFNVKWDEVEREYTSRFKNESAPVDEMSYIPGVPFYPRLQFTYFF